MIMNPYTAERRDVSENQPPTPKRFPKGGDFAPRGPRAISRAEGGVFFDTSRLEAVHYVLKVK